MNAPNPAAAQASVFNDPKLMNVVYTTIGGASGVVLIVIIICAVACALRRRRKYSASLVPVDGRDRGSDEEERDLEQANQIEPATSNVLVVPLSERTFLTSNMRSEYIAAVAPDKQHELVNAVYNVIVMFSTRHGIPSVDAEEYFSKLQSHSFKRFGDSLLLSKNVSVRSRLNCYTVWNNALTRVRC